MKNAVAFGGGVNSTALLAGLRERSERPDAIVFADTGGERPETYAHIEAMRAWCESVGFPTIESVYATYQGERETLEGNCLRIKSLPSLAYGFKMCSQKFKRQPQEKYLRHAFPEGEIVRLIGFDAGESHRAARGPEQQGRFRNRYPLIEWGWDRELCLAAIDRAGIERPPKSSCFFCPAMTKREIMALPCDLLERAMAMEDNAVLTTVEGLGRRFNWRRFVEGQRAQSTMFDDIAPAIACECYDGGDSDD